MEFEKQIRDIILIIETINMRFFFYMIDKHVGSNVFSVKYAKKSQFSI